MKYKTFFGKVLIAFHLDNRSKKEWNLVKLFLFEYMDLNDAIKWILDNS